MPLFYLSQQPPWLLGKSVSVHSRQRTSRPTHSPPWGLPTVGKPHGVRSEDLGSRPGSLPHCEVSGMLATQPGLVFCKTGERNVLWVITQTEIR